MQIVRGDAADRATTQAYFEVVRAADAADDPLGPPASLRRVLGWLEHPYEPMEAWGVTDEVTGTVAGWYLLTLPARENLDRGYLDLFVHPAARRRGLGTALLRHAAGRSRQSARTVLASWAFQDSAGAAFAAAAGAAAGLVEARRLQVISEISAGRVKELRQEAAQAAAGYSLLRWDGRVPDEYLDRYAALENAMNDAPRDEGEEPERWDADRVRERLDNRERRGRHLYTVAARHDASGALAAVTTVEADRDNPGWGHQQLTVVTREHRGHRLGLLVKAEMLDWLAKAEPGMDRIVTGNAANNEHMIAINEALGYRLLQPGAQSFELPVAAVLG